MQNINELIGIIKGINFDGVINDKEETQSEIEVIFNVFKKLDYNIYKRLLKAD